MAAAWFQAINLRPSRQDPLPASRNNQTIRQSLVIHRRSGQPSWGLHRSAATGILLAMACLGSASNSLAAATPDQWPEPPLSPQQRQNYSRFLQQRYGFNPSEISWEGTYPVIIRGSDEAAFTPRADCDKAPLDRTSNPDVIVVGAGPAGLTAAFYLTRANRSVLLLEKEPVVGGLAVGSNLLGGGAYGRGGAYFTGGEGELEEIYEQIGMGDYSKSMLIPEPIDSYYWNGKYYRGLWESETALAALTADFAAFKYTLQKLDEEGHIANQPLDADASTQWLDKISFADWTRRVPQELQRRQELGDLQARSLLKRLQGDRAIDQKNPMQNVLGLLELYGRSALGDSAEKISAAAFANFYISELGVRYSSNVGAGGVTRVLWNGLKGSNNLTTKTRTAVARIKNIQGGVEVCYVENNRARRAIGRDAVFSAPLRVALHTMPELAEKAPEKQKLIQGLEYRNYQVVNLHVQGHPWQDTYDLWVREDKTYTRQDPTDLIDGRWMDFRGEQQPRTDDKGVLTIYYPLPPEVVGQGFDRAMALKIAEQAAAKASKIINPLIALRHPGAQPIRILAIEANRWPFSIHIAAPGHLTMKSKILAEPLGRIQFANNNIGTPSIDEAVYRGHQAAQAILQRETQEVMAAPGKPRRI